MGRGVPGGYRQELYKLLTDSGYHVDFLGTQNVNPSPDLPDSDHEGHDGWRIDQIDSIIPAVLDKVDDPDIVLLLIGTNDYSQNYDTTQAATRLESLIEHITAQRPFAKVIVANLLRRAEPYDSQIQTTFNPFVPEIVDRQRSLGRQVFFADMRSAVPLSDLTDQLHPNAEGYAKMATNWFGMITNLAASDGIPDAPAVSRIATLEDFSKIKVIFNKPISDESAFTTNFSLGTNGTIYSAHLDGLSKREVTLTTSGLTPETTYTLAVTSISDRTALHRTIASGFQYTFISSVRAFILSGAGVNSTRNFTVSWHAEAGRSYRVWKKTSLASASWTQVGELFATSDASLTYVDPQPSNGSAFYKISSE